MKHIRKILILILFFILIPIFTVNATTCPNEQNGTACENPAQPFLCGPPTAYQCVSQAQINAAEAVSCSVAGQSRIFNCSTCQAPCACPSGQIVCGSACQVPYAASSTCDTMNRNTDQCTGLCTTCKTGYSSGSPAPAVCTPTLSPYYIYASPSSPQNAYMDISGTSTVGNLVASGGISAVNGMTIFGNLGNPKVLGTNQNLLYGVASATAPSVNKLLLLQNGNYDPMFSVSVSGDAFIKRLGVGASSLTKLLEVSDSANIGVTAQIRLTDSSGNQNPEFQLQYLNTDDKYHWGINASSTGVNAANFNIWGPNVNANPLGAYALTILDNGNVGINLINPTEKLTVAGNVSSTGLCLNGICKNAWDQVAGTSYWILNSTKLYPTSSVAWVGVNTSTVAGKNERLRIDGGVDLTDWLDVKNAVKANFINAIGLSGSNYFMSNVGIGTTTPAYNLTTVGSFAVFPSLAQPIMRSSFTNASDVNYEINRLTLDAPSGVSNDIYFRGGTSGKAHSILSATNLNIIANGGQINFGKTIGYPAKGDEVITVPYMTMLNGGNIGIGTVTPGIKLVVGSSTVPGGNIIGVQGPANDWVGFRLSHNSTGAESWFIGSSTTNDGLVFRRNSAIDDLFISSASGYVGVGTTTGNVRLEVAGNLDAGYLYSSGGLIAEDIIYANKGVTTNVVTTSKICFGSDCRTSWTGSHYVDATSVQSTGNMAINGLTGYKAANDRCNTKSTGSHLCTVEEILYSINSGATNLPNSGWHWISSGAPQGGTTGDCDGWTNVNTSGVVWSFDLGQVYAVRTTCNQLLSLACCK